MTDIRLRLTFRHTGGTPAPWEVVEVLSHIEELHKQTVLDFYDVRDVFPPAAEAPRPFFFGRFRWDPLSPEYALRIERIRIESPLEIIVYVVLGSGALYVLVTRIERTFEAAGRILLWPQRQARMRAEERAAMQEALAREEAALAQRRRTRGVQAEDPVILRGNRSGFELESGSIEDVADSEEPAE